MVELVDHRYAGYLELKFPWCRLKGKDAGFTGPEPHSDDLWRPLHPSSAIELRVNVILERSYA
jgi:hypothetical protein